MQVREGLTVSPSASTWAVNNPDFELTYGAVRKGSLTHVMKKEKIINRVFIFLTVLVMVLIFFFSSQNGDESAHTSSTVVRFILSIFIRGFSAIGEEEKLSLISQYSHIVRKVAHFTEFAALGFCLSVSLSTSKRRFRVLPRSGAALLVCALYAISDEAHQILSDGRGPSLVDCAIDISGSAVGIITALVISYLIGRRHK